MPKTSREILSGAIREEINSFPGSASLRPSPERRPPP
jgi:hypothetical protein